MVPEGIQIDEREEGRNRKRWPSAMRKRTYFINARMTSLFGGNACPFKMHSILPLSSALKYGACALMSFLISESMAILHAEVNGAMATLYGVFALLPCNYDYILMTKRWNSLAFVHF